MDVTKYKNTMEYPKKPSKPKLPVNHTALDAKNHAESMTWWESEMEAYRENIGKYRSEEQRLLAKFKEDVLEYCGISNHPKAEKLYAIAWDKGHSAGLYEVYLEVDELSELIK